MRPGTGVWKMARLGVALVLLAGAGMFLMSEPTPPFTASDKAYYASEATVNFVRPGLTFKITNVQIAADGTVSARFTITDPRGLGLDRTGVQTPGTVSSSWLLAYIPKGQTQYVSYVMRTQTSPITGVAARQPTADTGGTYTVNGEGDYTYRFGTKLPADYDRTATHSVGVYGSRNLTEFDLGTNYDDDVYTFVPDGSRVTVTRDVIKTATCNKCHASLGLHGGSRKSMELCVMCHYTNVIDPDTGNSVAMDVMTHKIHAGHELPSVAAGGSYKIIGFNQSVNDYSHVGFPADGLSRNCQMCHESGMGAAQENAWLTNPNRLACGSCHDNVNFATGANHVNLPQFNDNQCKNCHIPEGELDFDASIKGAHVVPHRSTLSNGIVLKIVSVENLKPGQKPTVNFTLTDKKGTVLDASKISRVAITIAGPTTDYVASFPGQSTPGYLQESAAAARLNGSTYSYTFNNALPADAKGTYAVSMEGRVSETLLAGTLKQLTQNFGADNPIMYVSVDGSQVVPRRTIVDQAKCNACHGQLTLHGENRNQISTCIMCHNPVQNDASRRTAAVMPAESIDMSLMIHRIHAGEEQTRDYTIYGFGNTPHNYNGIAFPTSLARCTMCHVDGTQNLPVKAVAEKKDVRGLLNPVKPVAAACLGCHTSIEAASHALANTTVLGESCGVCHGVNSDFSVAKVHAQ